MTELLILILILNLAQAALTAVVVLGKGEDTEKASGREGRNCLEEHLLQQAAEQYHLSQREQEIARLLCQGRNNKDIADQLFLSPNTVKVHASNLYRKLGVKNRVQAVQTLEGMQYLQQK